MATRNQRLVERIQNRSRDSLVLPGFVNANDHSELESRVHRLHAVGDSYAHVRLSEYVAPRGATHLPVRDGATCVATDA